MESKKNRNIDPQFKSGLYFALGLNLMLFITWQALEHKSYDKPDYTAEIIAVNEILEDDIPITTLNTPPPPPPPAAAPEVISVVENIEEIEETVIESTETSQEERVEDIVEVEDITVEEVEEDILVPFAVVETVPVFPGCKGRNNDVIKRCFQTKMQEHITKNFKYPERAMEMGIQGKVFVIFTVGKDGKITQIRTRGPDRALENEANRIFELLPDMVPGKQRGKPVSVSFSIPVFFKLLNQ